jgi:transcription initiation factor TFIIIB Brf1 subunit/transcription initiation factor TFIIB
VATGSVQEEKNRISRKIKNVAEHSKVPLKIQNNSRRLKTLAENLNLQPNVGRSAGNLKLQRNN